MPLNYLEEKLAACLGNEAWSRIQQVRVGIAGAGGLGSNCAFNLVRSGFKHLVVVDFDRVDYSNLNRQFYFYHQAGRTKVLALQENLLAINPDLNIRIFEERVVPENIDRLFAGCDVIVEAFDEPAAKKMLVEHFAGRPVLLVAASGMAGCGNSDDIRIHRIGERFFLVGDLYSQIDPYHPPLSPRTNLTAAKQADIILDYFLHYTEEGEKNQHAL